MRPAFTAPRGLQRLRRLFKGWLAWTTDPFAAVSVPTLLLVGGESPPRELESARAIAAALPDAQVTVLEGQQHTAMHSAPDVFVRQVVEFLIPVS